MLRIYPEKYLSELGGNMDNNAFDGMNFADIPKIDLSYATDMVYSIQSQIEEDGRRTRRMAEEAYNNRQKMQKAIEQTAVNTGETNIQLQKVVENQNAYIDILKEQLSIHKKQLELDEQQLMILRNIFASEEDGIAVEKEIMKLIQEQIDASHPLWEYIKDKGGDVAVAGVTAGIPVIYSAIKVYFLSKGIQLP